MSRAPHLSVMLDEVIEALAPRPDSIIVDGTFGAGGYSRGLLAAGAGRVVGIDRDPTVRPHAEALAAEHPGRFDLLSGCFGDMADLLADLLAARGITRVDGVALDLGVSSMQLDQAERGFSFSHDGPLDMRMGREGTSAADLVNQREEGDLAQLIARLGEERHARRVARAIVRRRAEAPFTRTHDLAEVVRGAIPLPRKRPRGAPTIDPATRTFQALRIAVNDELGELTRGLLGAERLLAAGGRLAVVSFHSLEDRIVKDFVRARSARAPGGSRHLPPTERPAPSLIEITPRPRTPSDAECAANPRARSARLRIAERTEAPAWPADPPLSGEGPGR
ncbi:16S rRNA (cytosine(1402)-N(4))-methyltransferase RsmH [Roseospirillum parvum]|uniref:Ribosomal RNA small subunit methyltransferase H n=1 Tax=Roseospirillum parvum TaxID=83401 RepID=A0A1G7UC93_9PROT|nr:16S rRNA (cytosine(1402)-N(4))-methyltransferase RsmH [Roseospirillum parvum]SDG45064.1 16S rRNA (cytosine1402-N4)-methyltransferase [Roseospirillum parvum]